MWNLTELKQILFVVHNSTDLKQINQILAEYQKFSLFSFLIIIIIVIIILVRFSTRLFGTSKLGKQMNREKCELNVFTQILLNRLLLILNCSNFEKGKQ